ncbi:MAG: hypothetical protein JWO20_2538 [Candidatus Angelobacter sp.]|nr:hypothetical protein [Candidatus Angelobacter sp.]
MKSEGLEEQLERFTASDIREITGLTYRQVNDWDSKGALPNEREGEAGWRKFSSRELFVIVVCTEIRRCFGVPIEKLAWLKSFMLKQNANHFQSAVKMVEHGLAVCILTDFETTFLMDSDVAFENYFHQGYFRRHDPQNYILLGVNSLVNKVLSVVLTEKIQLEIAEEVYEALGRADALHRAQDAQEAEVLRIMRLGFSSLKMKRKSSGDLELEIERDVVPGTDLNELLGDEDYQTLITKKHGGHITRITRSVSQRVEGKGKKVPTVVVKVKLNKEE